MADNHGIDHGDRSFKICSVLGGLDVMRLVSSSTRSFFGGAIEDVEMIREFVSEAITNKGIRGGLSNLAELNQTLDWVSRDEYEVKTTTLEAGLGYSDDRIDRRIDRFVGVTNKPLVGDKETDMAIVDSVSLIFPWIVDRKSNQEFWKVDHQNGKSEGPGKEPFLFDSLYSAAWIGSYGEAWAYYPPLNPDEDGKPFTLGDVIRGDYNSHEEPFVKPNLPENNPSRKAFFTTPYPDTAQPGVSLITAMAPIYYTGSFRNFAYDDTYIASTGLDIGVTLVSSLLEVLDDTLTSQSFGILVNAEHFGTIVLTQSVVNKIYPERTGFEKERVTYNLTDGSIIDDRRNQTYLVSDTILQDLTSLKNANWTGLLSSVNELVPGERGYSTLDLTLTDETSPIEFYVMYERWQYIADWVLLVFAPTFEVDNAIKVGIFSKQEMNDSSMQASSLFLEGEKGVTLTGEATLVNSGSLDVELSLKTIPPWIRLMTSMEEGQQLRAGENLSVEFDVLTDALEFGTSSILVTFNVRDDHYPECFHNQDLSLKLSVKVTPVNCLRVTGDKLRVNDQYGNCICPANVLAEIGGKCVANSVLLTSILVPLFGLSLLAVYFFVRRKRMQTDSIWAVKNSELRFDNPPEIVGRGTFGLVLAAEYRGTQVAVKRVIPPRLKAHKEPGKTSESRNSILGAGDNSGRAPLKRKSAVETKRISNDDSTFFDFNNIDEVDDNSEAKENGKVKFGTDTEVTDDDGVIQCNALEAGTFQRRQSDPVTDRGQQFIQPITETDEMVDKSPASIPFNINGLKSGTIKSGPITAMGSGSMRIRSKIFGLWNKNVRFRDEYSRLKADFVDEMRHLSTLRHPCITTVMGAVISNTEEPMLVMELMEHGSLYDVLHNETMVIEGEVVLPILRDIAQGLRFLHSATPQVIHGDLKAQNILVDSKFRAKVADFGLSQKKKLGASGTPLWMAPELLRGESVNTAASDVYSFGIILYELYSRKDPYQGEEHGQVLRQVCDQKVNKRPPIPSSMPPAIASLMSECLVKPPGSRPTFDELDNRIRRLDVANVEPCNMRFSAQNKELTDAERNANLLLQVFPKHIAEALRDGRKVEPEHHDCVTIFFSDIVGFTIISASISLTKLAEMLDRLYTRLDQLSHQHDVFKIETIGDAWMGVTNLVKDQPDHAKRLAEFAIDAIQAASETAIDLEDPSAGFVQIRVGFHSGPVLANVIGSRNPKYSIFGDAVNTSSRMESHSLPGRIQCSERAAILLKAQGPDVPLLYRGTIHVKGKGEMDTYWVNEEYANSKETPPETHVSDKDQKLDANAINETMNSEALSVSTTSDPDVLPPL